MPKRTDISSILLIGSGPIVIGQACEFDYSGTQAIKALKEEGYKVILINSNPATIMTDPEFADKTYIEPITVEFVEEVIKRERPDAILPTMGGQTALNIAIELEERGILEKYNCELIGAKVGPIKTAEDRALFRTAMEEIGLESAKSGIAHSIEDAEKIALEIGYPLILRPSRTLGGTGGGVVHNHSELHTKVSYALACSPNREVLVEESLTGWKEMELEVMRDLKDNVVIICGIENFDPMGVHTGDSITVAPIQTLTDKEYERLRDAAIKIMRKIGVDTGGSNVQFSIDPKTGRFIVIEMNPRVSRSSALASKATGYPIAKIAAKLAVGYTLDELKNDITKDTPASFEPSIDYTVVKIPRFNFEKFPNADTTLGTQMKSVGEVMAFGRSFSEALQKALYSMELGSSGFDRAAKYEALSIEALMTFCATPSPNRIWYVGEALRRGVPQGELYLKTGIDPWFLAEIATIIQTEQIVSTVKLSEIAKEDLFKLKKMGFSDLRLAQLLACKEQDVMSRRHELGIRPNYKSVDTCAAEFVANTPYLYSTYDGTSEAPPTQNKKVVILGSGPNRIGQGIEFDYCCVHAVFALRKAGFEAIMINCNPETVSTDYDVSDRLYFEPLTLESVVEILDREKPYGVIVQFGGQTPLKLAGELHARGVKILGTSVDSIDIAEDRERFSALVKELGLRQPECATARSLEEAKKASSRLGFPLMIRPSFVLGGRSMRILFSEEDLVHYLSESVEVSHDRPVLLDRYLNNAIELDVDALCDGSSVIIAGVMEHIERAGIHSGDSSCCIPPPTISADLITILKKQTTQLARALNVKGLLNVQFAVTKEGIPYILEANPRASRTVPFVSKATGVPFAKMAALVMAGKTIAELGIKEIDLARASFRAIKACVFPFNKFAGVDTILGPEMKSTGEVMGIHSTVSGAFAKSQAAVGVKLPTKGCAFISVSDADKAELPAIVMGLIDVGFEILATTGTTLYLKELGFSTVRAVNKVREGSPHIVDKIRDGSVQLVINTPEGASPHLDSRSIRLSAFEQKVPTYTTVAAALAAVQSIRALISDKVLEVCSLQEYHTTLTDVLREKALEDQERVAV
jgi:carbamoyl-phosphate synthase large subunit